MPILNYSTTIPPDKTIAEITKRLAQHGASRIATDYADGQPVGVSFVITNPETGQPQQYSLPVDVEAMQRVLVKQFGRGKGGRGTQQTSPEQAARVAWRVMKDWVAAQLALAETQMVRLDEIMLPYMHLDEGGTTVLDNYRARTLELMSGES